MYLCVCVYISITYTCLFACASTHTYACMGLLFRDAFIFICVYKHWELTIFGSIMNSLREGVIALGKLNYSDADKLMVISHFKEMYVCSFPPPRSGAFGRWAW